MWIRLGLPAPKDLYFMAPPLMTALSRVRSRNADPVAVADAEQLCAMNYRAAVKSIMIFERNAKLTQAVPIDFMEPFQLDASPVIFDTRLAPAWQMSHYADLLSGGDPGSNPALTVHPEATKK